MVITCIDFSNDGHREHLMRSAIKSVLDTGNIAICISNDTRLLQSWVEQHHTDASERLICHSYSPEPLKENRRNGRFRDVLSAVHLWRSYQKILNNIEKQYHLKIDVVVFHYIDLFLASLLPVFLQKMIFTYKWAALYIHPRYLRMYKASGIQHQRSVFRDIDHLLKSNRCVGVGSVSNLVARVCMTARQFSFENCSVAASEVMQSPAVHPVKTRVMFVTMAERKKETSPVR